MEQQTLESDSLYELYQQLNLSVDQFDTAEGFTVFNLNAVGFNLPYKSAAYRPNFFSFLFVKDGEGTYGIDQQEFHVQRHSVYFTNPSNYRTFSWQRTDDVYLVTFDEAFLKKYIGHDVFEEFPFLLTETVEPKVLSDHFYTELEWLYLGLEREYHNPHNRVKYKTLGHLLAVLLLKIKVYFWNDYNPIQEGNRGSQIVSTFKQLLEQHYRELSSGKTDVVFRVQDYAARLHLHPNYLSNVIRVKTGKPIATWIAEKTIAEAMAMLINPAIPIKEVSYRLGFSEVAHFSNYFKKHTALSPTAFRKQNNSL